MLLDYNSTKGGVNTINQMVEHFSCKCGMQRWPLALLMNLIDITALSAYIIFRESTGTTVVRRKFLQTLAINLAGEYVSQRSTKVAFTVTAKATTILDAGDIIEGSSTESHFLHI